MTKYYIHTYTVVVGSAACNLDTQYGHRIMTGALAPVEEPNFRNFKIGCDFSSMSGAKTILFTGKGEPTLYPQVITQYLDFMNKNNVCFPFKELQTNGVLLDPQCGNHTEEYAKVWYDKGMTLICFSIAHYDPSVNNSLLNPIANNYNFWRAVEAVRKLKYSVRINCTLVKGGVDTPEHLDKLMECSKNHGVAQTTVRMVSSPDSSQNPEVLQWVKEHQFDDYWVEPYILFTKGKYLLDLPHGAKLYDRNGRNICVSTCLTESKSKNDLIHHQDRKSTDERLLDWYKGARLL